MASTRDIQVGDAAARQWLNQNEGMYSGMISDSIITAVVIAVLHAVDTDRAKHSANTHTS